MRWVFVTQYDDHAVLVEEPGIALDQHRQVATRRHREHDPPDRHTEDLLLLTVEGQAQGMSYPLCVLQHEPDQAALTKAIRRARDTGFKGAVCAHASWVKACNEGFRPSRDEVEYYKEVRQVFAEGLKRGLASVPLNGKMIDVPVDLRAEVYLEWAERAAARDQQKIQAHQL